MSTSGHKPASNPFSSYSVRDITEYVEQDEEEEWSEEEEDFDDFDYDDDDYDYDDFEEDSDEYYEEKDEANHRNNHEAGPGNFYPEQPYTGLPIVPKPSPEASSSKLRYYILSPISDIVRIYIKLALLAIVFYAAALWYTVHYGDMDSINGTDEDDSDTCPASQSV